jgi:N-acylneuraminate cytidylyltransferase
VSLINLAVQCAKNAGIELVRITTDIPHLAKQPEVIWRPDHLANDLAAMIDVVKHALEQIPGPSDQIVVLLQCTQPFRTPAHVRAAIELLQSSEADSVVSVVELPRTHSHQLLSAITPNGFLVPISAVFDDGDPPPWHEAWRRLPWRRQDAPPSYLRDGTVIAFRRQTVEQYGTLYGDLVRPLIIPPEETCGLDTESDWADCVRRWEAKRG